MTGPSSPLGSHIHSYHSNGFEYPNFALPAGPSMIDNSSLDTMLPIIEGPVPGDSNFTPFETLPALTTPMSSSVTSFPWLDLPHLEKDDRSSYYSELEQSSGAHPNQSSHGDLEYQGPGESDVWRYKASHGQADSSMSSIPWEGPSFHSANDIVTPARIDLNCVRRSFSSLSLSPNQQHPWAGSTVASTLNEVFAVPQLQPFDAADSGGQPLYTTAWNRGFASPADLKRLYQDFDDTTTLDSSETDDESGKDEPPYAKLIYDALMHAPEHQLVLRDIYAWVRENTTKAKDPAFKGWQNSVRHNLSMNGVKRLSPLAHGKH